MNKKLSLFFFLICYSLFSLKANQIRVFPKNGINPIHAALLIAKDYDTLLVQTGTYAEGNILLEKPITLIGINYPCIDGKFKGEVFTVSANYVTIIGFRIINSGYSDLNDFAAIQLMNSDFGKFINNKLEGNYFGIFLHNSHYNRIEKNTIIGPARVQNKVGNGIHLWNSSHNLILNNHIKKHRDGLYFEFSRQVLIANNTSEENLRYGLHFMFSDSDVYYMNSFINNGAGVAVMYSHHVTMAKNKFIHNWGSSAYGLLLKDIRDSKVLNNEFTKNTVAIYMDGCSRSELIKNNFNNNGYALRMQSNCDDNLIRLNNFRANTFDYATNGFMVLNSFNYNYWDKYTGYDLEKDGIGDQGYRPMNLLTKIIEEYPTTIVLLQSFLSDLLNLLEKVLPSLTPENLIDNNPMMNPIS
ncbi:MAG: nitrous oxide reductase family maturation protein NosD [Bacteroidia bacterium]|nr:nitrous oxide reductase family maturation protein NosD [Bacteroidia bacterium]MCF8427971.1 nitrous oxide reductase family maturation protein NosD [Bacteroidia bacterium]MCF8446317.1 nitrous oxide reductase family maturation protein NosD [Bacteroidia bacterium]